MSLWYYQDTDGAQVGPIEADSFRILRETGQVRDTTFVWRTGWSEWTTFADIWLHGNPPEIDPTSTPATTAATSDQGQVRRALPSHIISAPVRLEHPVVQQQLQKITYSKCSVCRQKWPDHLLFGTRRLYICAPCLKAHEKKRQERQQMRRRRSGINNGILNWALKLLLFATAVASAIVFFFQYMKGVSN